MWSASSSTTSHQRVSDFQARAVVFLPAKGSRTITLIRQDSNETLQGRARAVSTPDAEGLG